MTLPESRVADAHKMEADGIVYLYTIMPKAGGIIRVKNDNTVTWQGETWEGMACQLDQRGQNADGTRVRPKFTFANPEGAFSALVSGGVLNNAQVIETQVLYTDLLADNPACVTHTWILRRIVQLGRDGIQVELRDVTDGQAFNLPLRQFRPPSFPTVTM